MSRKKPVNCFVWTHSWHAVKKSDPYCHFASSPNLSRPSLLDEFLPKETDLSSINLHVNNKRIEMIGFENVL